LYDRAIKGWLFNRGGCMDMFDFMVQSSGNLNLYIKRELPYRWCNGFTFCCFILFNNSFNRSVIIFLIVFIKLYQQIIILWTTYFLLKSDNKICITYSWVIDCCLNTKSAIFQLYHGENKLINLQWDKDEVLFVVDQRDRPVKKLWNRLKQQKVN
jgi:hypothetical protein